MTAINDRCRLILITPDVDSQSELISSVEDALRGGDVATVIIPQRSMDEHSYQDLVSSLVPCVQDAGAAALLAGDTRIMGRCKADGLHVNGSFEDLRESIESFSPKYIVGGGSAKDRHNALSMGDLQPDYLFFGRVDGDIKPDAHPKNIELGRWWSEFVEIPCVVHGGKDIGSALAVAEAGCDFVAMNHAVFADLSQSSMKVAEINAILDEKAPRFEL